MKVSFEGVNEQVLSFKSASTTDGALVGKPVKMSANLTVAGCSANDVFVGFGIHDEDGFANVMTHGYVECAYTDTAPSVGYGILVASTAGKVKGALSGKEYLIIKVDTTNGVVGFML